MSLLEPRSTGTPPASTKVMKFGGSALATPDGIRRAAARICSALKAEESAVIIADAMGDNLTHLESLAFQVVPGAAPRETLCRACSRDMDILVSTGEMMSAALLSIALCSLGRSSVALTGWQAQVHTDSAHGRASIVGMDVSRICRELGLGRTVVVAGSQGANPKGDITTLGRDGADITAVALAAHLGLRHVEIFTDTDGLFTADPRVVPTAKQIAAVSYEEILELSTLGAAVVHPAALEYAKRYGIVLHIRSSFTTLQGTIVKEEDAVQVAADVRGVAHDTNITKMALVGVPDQPGIAYRVFEGLSAARINVDMIVQSQKDETTNDILFTVERQEADTAAPILNDIAKAVGAKGVTRDDRVAKVSIVGAGMANNSGVAARMFGALARRNINIEVISTSEIRISCLISATKVEDAVRAIHQEFGLDA